MVTRQAFPATFAWVVLFFACLLGLVPVAEAIEIRFEGDLDDSLTDTSDFTLRGTVDPPGLGMLQVRIGNQILPVALSQDHWEAKIPLAGGLNLILVSYGGVSRALALTLAKPLSPRPQQKVRLVWDVEADEQLRLIAQETLTTPPQPAELDQFVVEAKDGARRALLRAYTGAANLALVEQDGDDVYTIEMVSADLGMFGETPPPLDCGNRVLRGDSSVSLGFFRRQMRDHLNPDWAPMSRSDSLPVRAVDVAEALGRTAAHELGHGMGLVAERSSFSCGWMNGCDGSHTCKALQDSNPSVHRFQFGFSIMDPGIFSANNFRIAEPQRTRSTGRTPSTFDKVSRFYLLMVEPIP